MRGISKMRPPTLERLALAVLSAGLSFGLFALGGCGQTAAPVATPANGKVNTYFGGPFIVTVNPVNLSSSSFDHSANQISVSAFVNNLNLQVPSQSRKTLPLPRPATARRILL